MELRRLFDPCHDDLPDGWWEEDLRMKESLFNFQENLVKCGAAAAPVTDWLLYDTVYTERYMAKYPSITISITINITVMVMIVLLNTEI